MAKGRIEFENGSEKFIGKRRVITRNAKTREELSNPYAHIPHDQLLELAGVTDLRDNYTLEDLGNGYMRVVAIDETKKWKAEKRIPQRGDTYSDAVGDVKIMGVIDGYVMMRRKGCYPFLKSLKDIAKDFDFKCDKNGKMLDEA